MDILCTRTNVQLFTLTMPHQLKSLFHTTQATEVDLPLAPFQPEEAKNTCLACVQSPWIMLYPLSKMTKYALQGKVTITLDINRKKMKSKRQHFTKREILEKYQ